MALSIGVLFVAGSSGKLAVRADNSPVNEPGSHQQAAVMHQEWVLSKKRNLQIVSNAGLNQKAAESDRSAAAPANSPAATVPKSNEPIVSSSPGSNAVDLLDLAQMAPVCHQEQQTYTVPSAQLTLGSPPHADTEVRWYWETRIDSGATPATAPISDEQATRSMLAGSAQILLDNGDQPLVSAPTNADYAYSFRLHIVAPIDITSDWLSVPISDPIVCQ